MIVEVSGEYACFSRPELRMERVSYDAITPAAARAILEAVYWKPEMKYIIDYIEILNPVKRQQIFRNEIADVQSSRMSPIIADDVAGKRRAQRMSILLRDVKYRIHFRIVLTDKEKESPTNHVGKHYEIISRRINNGQHHSQPYFGIREYIVDELRVIENIADEQKPIDINNDCGFVFYDFTYNRGNRLEPIYYHCVIRNGVIDLTQSIIAQ